MNIGGKEYQIGQHVRVISAKSVLHYEYGIVGNENKDMRGITGVIVAESIYAPKSVCNLRVDEPYSKAYKNGMTRLFKDDEIELLN